MTNREVVAKLRELGHEVDVYIRKDGSIRVTSIDGVKYSPRLSKGVEAARNILFNAGRIEEAEYTREAIKAQRTEAREIRASGDTLRSQTKNFQAEFKRLQRQIKQLNKRLIKEGKRPFRLLSWKNFKYYARLGGQTIQAQLNRMRDYYGPLLSNVAPLQYVESLLDDLRVWAQKHPELQRLVNVVEEYKHYIDVAQVDVTYNWAYGYVKGVEQSETLSERIQKIKDTAHVPTSKK